MLTPSIVFAPFARVPRTSVKFSRVDPSVEWITELARVEAFVELYFFRALKVLDEI